jgi:hypothetical protein
MSAVLSPREPWYSTTPEGCAQRKQRISDAQAKELARLQKLSDARALIRSAGINNERELLQFMQCIHAAYVDKEDHYAKELLEICSDLDADLFTVQAAQL